MDLDEPLAPMEVKQPFRLWDASDAFTEQPLSGIAREVLGKPTEHAVFEVFGKEGDVIFTSDVCKPGRGDNFMYAEDVAVLNGKVSDLDSFLGENGQGLTIRLTTTLDPWEKCLTTTLKTLLVSAEKYNAELSLVSAHGSDADQITAKAHIEAFGGSKRVTVVRYNPNSGTAKGPVFLFKGGVSNLEEIFKLENPDSFGAAGNLDGIERQVQQGALGGLASNLLLVDKGDVSEAITELTTHCPELKAVYDGTATYETMEAISGGLEEWGTINGKNGANYLLFYMSGGLKSQQLLDELRDNPDLYKCVGLSAVIESLEKFCATPANGEKPFVFVNSGETTDLARPGKHVGDEDGGNALPRTIGRAIRNLAEIVHDPDGGSEVCVEPTMLIRLAWDSSKEPDDDVKASQKRMTNEAVLSSFLHTQQGPADSLDEGVQRDFFLGGMNFISAGQSRGDPLRTAGSLQKGGLGLLTLKRLLELTPSQANGVEFLIDGLKQSEDMDRGEALTQTAKYAFSSYCSMNGATASNAEGERGRERE